MDKKMKILYGQVKNLQSQVKSDGAFIISKNLVREYNELLEKVIEIDISAKDYCKHIIIPEEPLFNSGRLKLLVLLRAYVGGLVAYLDEHTDKKEEFVNHLINLLIAKLRSTLRSTPENEKQVQDAVDTVLNVSNYQYLREQISIPYSSKSVKPDFTFEGENIALEIKFCNRTERGKKFIEEINSDITAYRTKYKTLIFLVYDTGFIRDVQKFKKDISNESLDVYVEVVKN